MLDAAFNEGIRSDSNTRRASEGENQRDFFEELTTKKERRGKKSSKVGSMIELQNRSLTVSERRRRDKALKRRNWNRQLLEEIELFEKLLSDSDIQARCSILIKEARQLGVLNLRKLVLLPPASSFLNAHGGVLCVPGWCWLLIVGLKRRWPLWCELQGAVGLCGAAQFVYLKYGARLDHGYEQETVFLRCGFHMVVICVCCILVGCLGCEGLSLLVCFLVLLVKSCLALYGDQVVS
ncbi:hypothetical protein V6N13_068784 [Hibiscus sabdariffa]